MQHYTVERFEQDISNRIQLEHARQEQHRLILDVQHLQKQIQDYQVELTKPLPKKRGRKPKSL